MHSSTDLAALAAALADARRGHRLLDAADWADTVISDTQAYDVQARVARTLGWFDDARPRCWKTGGARGATLTHAALAPAGVRASPAVFADVTFHTPLVEAEIALRVARDVSAEEAATLTDATAEALVDAMCVSIEIVDSRWRDFPRAQALLRLADSQVHGALVLGAWVPYVRGHDWASQRCDARVGERTIEKTGTHPLGEPAYLLLQWMRHVTRDGEVLRAGSVVTTGTWTGMTPVKPGEAVSVAFDGIGRADMVL